MLLKEERGCIGKRMHRKILYSLLSLLYSTNLPTGGNPKPIGGERKVQLIMFTYLDRYLPELIRFTYLLLLD